MAIITVEELEASLTQLGIDYSDYEENLEQLLTSYIQKLIGLTGAPILSKTIEEMEYDYSGKTFQFKVYPISEVKCVCLNGNPVDEELYVLDGNIGVLYFTRSFTGLLKLTYTVELSEQVIDTLVNPLLVDMLGHDISKGFNWDGEYSTVKEGDVSISFDTSTGSYAGIQNRINELKYMYSYRAKLL